MSSAETVGSAASDARGILIRSAKPEDVDALLKLKLALQIEESSPDAFVADKALWAARMFGPERRFEALVAEHATSLIGMLVFNMKYYTGWPAPALSLDDLFVDKSFRRQGIGLLLLRRLAERAQECNAEHIELTVSVHNPARRFYESAGLMNVESAVTYVGGRQTIDALADPATRTREVPATNPLVSP